MSARKRLIVPGVARRDAGGLILPGDAPAGARTLLVPRGHEDAEPLPIVGYCHVPGCDREGQPFFAGQEEVWQKHVGWCARRNRDEIERVIAEHKEALPIFRNPDAWDPEVKEHMRKVGARMIREGRLTVKPSERAGFS